MEILKSKNISCSPNWHSSSLSDRSYCLYLFVLGFLLPLTVIISTSAVALRAIQTVRTNNIEPLTSIDSNQSVQSMEPPISRVRFLSLYEGAQS